MFSLCLDPQYRNKCLAMRSIFVQCQWRLLGNKTYVRCSVILSTSPKKTLTVCFHSIDEIILSHL